VAICFILWSFGTFFLFWYVVPRKIWQPCLADRVDGFNDFLQANAKPRRIWRSPGLPDGICIFRPKNPNLGKFLKVLQWKM
jgi:hypothetical protein